MQFFITGTSSGIGEALAKRALEEGHRVNGYSRRNSIKHPHYRHQSIDLSKLSSFTQLNFNLNKEAEKLVLINNAGWLGEVKPMGKLTPEKIDQVYRVNITAPAILTSLFLEQTENTGQERMIINISSGAGSYPVPSWSTYCSSKAALDMLTRVTQLDQPGVKCFSIAPGIVDTEMQGEIRRLDNDDFPEVQRFVDYKQKGDLAQPASVAKAIFSFVENPASAPSIVFSLRDL